MAFFKRKIYNSYLKVAEWLTKLISRKVSVTPQPKRFSLRKIESAIEGIIPIIVSNRAISLVKITYFFVVNFVKGTTIYINLRLKLSYFSSVKFRSVI